jgi:hypothetical protein
MRFLLAALLLASTVASADDQPVRSQGTADDCARARKLNKTCVLDMGKEDIEAGVSKPDGIGFSAREWAYMNSLINIRRDFIPEIIKSAEDL